MSEFYEGLAEIFEVAESEINPDFNLADHNWDSLAVVSTIALVDSCFNKLLDGKTLAACVTVSDIEALIDKATP